MPLFLQPFAKYADFNGRARRTEYWQWFAFQVVVGFVFGVLKGAGGAGLFGLLQAIFSLAVLVPSIAVSVRRFHDINRTGWWHLFPSAVLVGSVLIYIPFGGTAFIEAAQNLKNNAGSPSNSELTSAMAILLPMLWVVLAFCAAALVTFIFHVTPGTDGPNRFGADPKGSGTDIARVFDAPERAARETYDDGDKPYKPVFDFGPTSKPQSAAPAMDIPAPARPAPQSGAPAKPVFGKRR